MSSAVGHTDRPAVDCRHSTSCGGQTARRSVSLPIQAKSTTNRGPTAVY